jgi:pimeloyl-ACP methyl ester carboxylesterase
MLKSFLVLTFVIFAAACSTPPDTALPPADVSAYQALRAGYAARDANAIRAAYAPGALVKFENETPPQTAEGYSAIKDLYAGVLNSLPKDQPLDLNFRIDRRTFKSDRIVETGAYRLKAGKAGSAFGRFAVERDRTTGLFVLDRSLPGSREDFESIIGAVLLDADVDDLDPDFYGRLTGRYTLSDGCSLVVTHSVVRVLVRNTCDQSWRGLDRINGTTYTFGAAIRPESSLGDIRFALADAGLAGALTESRGDDKRTAKRDDPYTRSDVTFSAPDGTELAGTLWRPKTSAKAATVLIHGSGPQDRNGYASIMAVMADALAANGHLVLAYDKRGSGASYGNGDRAGFDILASDAEASRQFLMSIPEAKGLPSGFAGSSQAGWVAAEAVRGGATPSHVILIGAAGSAVTVEEQNLYNTEVLMRCAGVEKDHIRLALSQQRAFFDVLSGRPSASELDQLTRAARNVPALADWIFSSSAEIDRTSADWFNVLDLDFDPLPVWSSYKGSLIFILGQHDDSTPTSMVIDRWEKLKQSGRARATLSVIPDAQHLGLKVSNLCETDFTTISGFSPGFFAALDQAARTTAGQ